MSSPINSGSFSKALWPGINAWYGKEYSEYPVEWTDLFDQFTSRKAFEEDVGVSSFRMFRVKPEGQAIEFDTEVQGFVTRYTHIEYGLGFVITKIMVEDDLYDVVAERKAKSLAFAGRQTYETIGANVYNRAFNSSYTGGDGVSLINSAHPNVVGGTWSNTLSVAAGLSEAALEQAVIDISRFQTDSGMRANFQARSLHIPVDLQFTAERILKSQYRVGTANNDINALVSMGKFPGGIKINHYFTSSSAWFLRTDCKNGMKHFSRAPMNFTEDNDWDTENAKYKATFRCSFGWTDPRALYGTAGV